MIDHAADMRRVLPIGFWRGTVLYQAVASEYRFGSSQAEICRRWSISAHQFNWAIDQDNRDRSAARRKAGVA